MTKVRRIGLRHLLVFALAVPAAAQCGAWTAGGGYPGVVGPNASRMPTSVSHLGAIDADGAGPGAPQLVVSGNFRYAGSVDAAQIAQFDPTTDAWSWPGVYTLTPLGPFATLANGDVAVLAQGGVWRLSGGAISPIATGLNGVPHAVVELSNGDLVVGGSFTQAGGLPTAYVARWNGTAWSTLGGGTDGPVYALARLPGDLVVAGGAFATAGGLTVGHIALWHGAAWASLGGGLDDRVLSLAWRAGEVVAAGLFTTAGGVPVAGLARWNGGTWASLGSGITGSVRRLALDTNGDLLVGGSFAVAGGVPAANIARWDGSTWSALGDGRPGPVAAIVALPGGGIFAATDQAGYFPSFGANATTPLARWDGTRWRAVGSGLDATVRAAAITPSGDLVFGGDFTQAGAVDAERVARWNGTAWSPLGAGVDGTVRALAALADGSVVAGGDFVQAGCAPANRVARWDGAAWSAMCAGADAPVRALAALPGGGVVAGGDFTVAGYVTAHHVACFDGWVWSSLGGGTDGSVRALVVLPNGDVIAGGNFTMAGGAPASRIARWDGAGWSPLGAGMNAPVAALAVLPDGDLVAGGTFTTAGGVAARHVARWDGATWTAMPTPLWGVFGEGVAALAVLANGDLVATEYNFGIYVPGQPASRVLRWNGTDWSLLATPNGIVHALAADRGGQLAVGGVFSAIDGLVTAFAARYATTCPATAASFGAGCAGHALVASTLPWVDTTFAATATGLPSQAIAVALSSFTAFAPGALPLANVLPQALPGCDLLVQPDIVQALAATGGSVVSSLFLPDTPPLVGMTFYHQVVPFEVDAGQQFLAITATNALSLTAGDL